MVKLCLPCKPHPFQDATYGKNQRVHTTCQGSVAKPRISHCTVCGKGEPQTKIIR